jgi:glycosyltransferase involved in cell wall biosynthesis
MRILQIAPLWESVPPSSYGGTEAVVHLLVEQLVQLGHEVTLCASGDSRTSAELRSCFPRSLRTATDLKDKIPYVLRHSAHSLAEADYYDIIHNHSGEEVMALAGLVNQTPMLTTTHCNITPDRAFIWEGYKSYYNTISRAQKRSLPTFPRARFAGVALNAIDVASFSFQAQKDGHLLFLGRISHEKGPHIAVEVARRAGRRLLIAGKVDDADRDYFESTMRPLIDNDHVIFLGEANGQQKRDLYRHARCVLMPIIWEEPFGLVMAEAQASGTPVITFNRGAAPEIVRHGETGFVCETAEEMVDAVSCIGEIDPHRCRSWVEEAFDGPVMANRYVELYGQIIADTTRPTALSTTAVTDTPVLSEQVA